MRIGVVQFPGSNCERETMLAIKRAEMEPVPFLWNEATDKLRQLDGYIIVGGFSYEDRSRAGIIAALDPVMLEMKAQSEKGKPILGICNGAQILVETGLVPGLENNKVGAALTENKRILHGKILGTGYYNTWVYLRLSDHYQRNAFTRHLTPKHIMPVPIAHGEGRFVMRAALYEEVKHQGLNVFQYCDATGAVIDEFPTNPNGSLENMAALSNKAGNVMAMMPHPERTTEGDAIFKSMREYLQEGKMEQRVAHTVPLYYYPRRAQYPQYKRGTETRECIVGLIINDNQVLTVQNTLRQLGFKVSVKRYVHWEINCETDAVFELIKDSGVLYNPRKEVLVDPRKVTSSPKYLVRSREDLIGPAKRQALEDHFFIQGLKTIQHSILWQFELEPGTMSDAMNDILQTNIIYNPYAHDCYHYC